MNTPLLPRGIRNNNPGNIRDVGIAWKGLAGRDAAGYCVFDTAEDGLRALAMELLHKYLRDGLNTVAKIIAVYAPPNENNTQAYIGHVAANLAVGINAKIDLADPIVLRAFLLSIVIHENGQQPYSPEVVTAAIGDALAAAGVVGA